MKKIILCMLFLVVFYGCATNSSKNTSKDSYETEIMIGQKRGSVLKSAEKIFGEPKQIGSIFEHSDYEVELRRYHFTNVSDFVMYFHEDIFIQAALMSVESPEYPPLRANYQSITTENPGPVLGYTLFMNNKEVVLDTIQP